MGRARSARRSRAPFVAGTVLGLLAFFLIAGLLTYVGRGDGIPGGVLAGRWPDATGLAGRAGARLCLLAFGWGGGWVFPALLFVWAWNRLRRHHWPLGLVPTLLVVTLAVASSSLMASIWQGAGGGAVGVRVAAGARALLGPVGSLIFLTLVTVLAAGFAAERELHFMGRHLARAGRAVGRGVAFLFRGLGSGLGALSRGAGEAARAERDLWEKHVAEAGRQAPAPPAPGAGAPPSPPRIVTPAPERARRAAPPSDPAEQIEMPVEKAPREPLAGVAGPHDAGAIPAGKEESDHEGPVTEEISLPSADLLDMPADLPPPVREDELIASSKILVQTLADFGVTGRVGEVHPGPVITRYEFEPAAGVRIAQILNRADDLALALRAIRIRIVAPIPGKAAVGVEIPNKRPATVYLREILDRPDFMNLKEGLPIGLGKDIGGKPFYADLTKMPHLLIAGTTGSGKSVCVNAILSSLILRKSPRELRLLMIDPKMLELPVYNGIPHLLMPVVTDPKQAARTLRGLITEMERRYAILARRGVRNIDLYHERLDEDERDGLEVIGERLPYIVAVIDELADLMVTTAAEVEEPIGRLAQTARAVGIHLIVATQRPSVDVLTGVIKANFPSRIAFQVASRTDSRTILDMNGADSLLGRGDMLFLPSGRPEPERVHGAFVSDRDTERLVRFWKRVKPKLPSIDLEAGDEKEAAGGLGGDDPLFEDAARVVVLHQQGSASLLQRRLKVGYSRAARLVDMLEEAGIVAPSEGSKAREVLVDDVRLEQILADRAAEALGK